MHRRAATAVLALLVIGSPRAAEPASPAGADAGAALPLLLNSGVTVDARLLKPNAPSPGRLPAVIVLGGFQRGAAALDLLPPVPDAMLVGLDYPARLPRRIAPSQVRATARELEAGIGTMIQALGALHAALLRRPDVDAERISIVGASLGSPFAVIAAQRYGYRGVVLAHGFADLPRTIRHQFARRWEPRLGPVGGGLAWLAQHLIGWLVELPEPERYAAQLRADQRVFVVTAASDEFIPAASSQALVDALRRSQAEVTVVQMPGTHMRGRNPEAIARLFELSTRWMREQGLL